MGWVCKFFVFGSGAAAAAPGLLAVPTSAWLDRGRLIP
jgi:hypothetical protein